MVKFLFFLTLSLTACTFLQQNPDLKDKVEEDVIEIEKRVFEDEIRGHTK